MYAAADSLPAKGDEGVSDDYRQLLGLLSHEYFHLWNVKRMKPEVFTPYDLTAESAYGTALGVRGSDLVLR